MDKDVILLAYLFFVHLKVDIANIRFLVKDPLERYSLKPYEAAVRHVSPAHVALKDGNEFAIHL